MNEIQKHEPGRAFPVVRKKKKRHTAATTFNLALVLRYDVKFKDAMGKKYENTLELHL